MPNAIKKGDKDTGGHLVTSQVSTTVFVDGKGAAHKGSKMNNGESIVTGSLTVFVEGQPMARKDDKTNKGHSLITVDQDVIIG